MKRKSYITVHEGVKIPSWALCYLINGDDSALEEEDKKIVDDWVETMREGGRIDVCCPKEGEEAYFCRYPAFGLPSDVEECDVVVDKSPRHGRCGYPCLNQSRFEPHKREAIDGKVWWCIFDNGSYSQNGNWLMGPKFKTRKDAIVWLFMEFTHDRLPYEPDDDRKGLIWLKGLKEIPK